MLQSKLQKAAICSFALVFVLFLLFFLYIDTQDGVSIYQARTPDSFETVTDYTMKELPDSSAPIGLRQEYRWTLKDPGPDSALLAFYLVHQYGEVYLGDELLYSLLPRSTNTIGKSIGSNWITVPLYSTDAGKEVRVVVTPIFESVRDRAVVFGVGSSTQIFDNRLRVDLPTMILSAFCCLLGIFIIVMQLVLLIRKRTRNLDMLYLGVFTLLLGVWKVTDTLFSPLLFQEHTILLSYLTIGCLYLACISLTIYFSGCFSSRKMRLLLMVSISISLVSLAVLVMQLLGVADFKESLSLAHISIIVVAMTLLTLALSQRSRKDANQGRRLLCFTIILFVGAGADLILFYATDSSSRLIFTLLAFVIYSLSLFITSIRDTNKRAYTDAQTGLFNKRRWENLMNAPTLEHESVGIMMCDLNRLKHINDTMGHDMGDKMILAFSNILRNTIPPTNTICRWGGDEFAILITGASASLMERYMSDIREAVDGYNASGEKPELQYAAGYALSEDFPELPLDDLFRQADKRMYADKRQWYNENVKNG